MGETQASTGVTRRAVAAARRVTRAATDHLQLLYEASQRLNRTLELDDLYQAVSEHMSVVAPNEGFSISGYDPETELITCDACGMRDPYTAEHERRGAGTLYDAQVVAACERLFADGYVLDGVAA